MAGGLRPWVGNALVTGRTIITDMDRNTDPKANIRGMVCRNMTESAHRVIKKLSGQGRKRKRSTSTKRGGEAKKAKNKLREIK